MLDSLGGKCRRQNSEFRRQKSEVQEFRSSGVQEPRTRIEDCGFCAVRTSERQPPNPELRTPNAKLRTPNPELQTPNHFYVAQSLSRLEAKHRIVDRSNAQQSIINARKSSTSVERQRRSSTPPGRQVAPARSAGSNGSCEFSPVAVAGVHPCPIAQSVPRAL